MEEKFGLHSAIKTNIKAKLFIVAWLFFSAPSYPDCAKSVVCGNEKNILLNYETRQEHEKIYDVLTTTPSQQKYEAAKYVLRSIGFKYPTIIDRIRIDARYELEERNYKVTIFYIIKI